MTCHFGYTLHHMALIVLDCLYLSWFLQATDRAVPLLLRFLICTVLILSMLFRTLMATACSSTATSDALHASWDSPLFRVRVLFFTSVHLVNAAVASHCISKAAKDSGSDESRRSRLCKLAKLVAVIGCPVMVDVHACRTKCVCVCVPTLLFT